MKKSITPAITATDAHAYREQVERVAFFAKRLHIDFMDGDFAPTVSPDIAQAWWPENITADFHVMYQHPENYINEIKKSHPALVIVHAEAEGFAAFMAASQTLKTDGVKIGVALLAETPVSKLKDYANGIDHVLIFSGDLGHFGGQANMLLLDKVAEVKRLNQQLEIGWDGGINDENASGLIAGGVEVLNVGGYIQRAQDPAGAYQKLASLL